MSCGLTPKLAEILQEASQYKNVESSKAEEEALDARERVARALKKNAALEQDGDENYDWTKVYSKWDEWQDPEELMAEEKRAREKAERSKASNVMCDHDHSAEQKLMDMSAADKLAKCEEFRLLGSAFVKQGQMRLAYSYYQKALVYFEYIFPDADDEERQLLTCQCQVLLNIALIVIRQKQGSYDMLIQYCTQVLDTLEQDANGSCLLSSDQSTELKKKAVFRRAQGYRLQHQFTEAKEDLDALCGLIGNRDRAVNTERRELMADKARYHDKSKQISKAMFQQPFIASTNTRVEYTVPTTTNEKEKSDYLLADGIQELQKYINSISPE